MHKYILCIYVYIYSDFNIYMIFNNSQTTTQSPELQPEPLSQPLDEVVDDKSHQDGGPRLHGEGAAV